MSLDFIKSLFGREVLDPAEVFEIIKIDSDYVSTMQIKNRTLKKMVEAVCYEYKLED